MNEHTSVTEIVYCCSGWEKIVDLLIDTGSDVNSLAYDASTPLMAAANEGK